MDFTRVIDSIKKDKLAGRKFQKSSRGKFRDVVTVCRNNRLRFQRYCYGEAASLVCLLWAAETAADGTINWDFSASDYSDKKQAPARLTGYENGALLFDEQAIPWAVDSNLKTIPEAGLGRLQMLFSR